MWQQCSKPAATRLPRTAPFVMPLAFPPPSPPADDHPSSKQIVEAFTAKYGLANKPKYIFGISAGEGQCWGC